MLCFKWTFSSILEARLDEREVLDLELETEAGRCAGLLRLCCLWRLCK